MSTNIYNRHLDILFLKKKNKLYVCHPMDTKDSSEITCILYNLQYNI